MNRREKQEPSSVNEENNANGVLMIVSKIGVHTCLRVLEMVVNSRLRDRRIEPEVTVPKAVERGGERVGATLAVHLHLHLGLLHANVAVACCVQRVLLARFRDAPCVDRRRNDVFWKQSEITRLHNVHVLDAYESFLRDLFLQRRLVHSLAELGSLHRSPSFAQRLRRRLVHELFERVGTARVGQLLVVDVR